MEPLTVWSKAVTVTWSLVIPFAHGPLLTVHWKTFAPMPNPRMVIATRLNDGLRTRLRNEILDAAYKAAVQLYSDESAKNPAFKKIYDPYLAFQKVENQWFSVAELGMDQFLQSRIK